MAKKQNPSLTLEPRSTAGTTSSKALRRAGKIPGVVYGHGETTAITLDVKALADLLHAGGRGHIVDATIAGRKDSVLLRRVDTDPVSRKPLHVDFQRVGKDEAIVAAVNVVTEGVPAGVRDQGGVMDLVTHALDIKGPASGIPDALTVDVRDLTVHTHVSAGDVKLPKGFTLVTPADTIVVSVSLSRAGAATETEVTPEPSPIEAPAGP
ncbi:MAG: 50S ribosomal protein L25 [Candidatus Eremiobacteraeota bacterium]|nr:50S ribosomal protein L25 [Candidatus Eremiobacteraeota bacterium]